jgi:hypothetical protein
MNQVRVRVRAIQKACPIAYRAKVLGRALLSARTDANSFWMLLSGNPEVAFSSRTSTIAAAANLPTPTTAAAAAVATANVAAVAAFMMPALTTTATGSLPTAAAGPTRSTASFSDAFAPTAAAVNVATPSASQKCKAVP